MLLLLIVLPWVILIFFWGGFWRADQRLLRTETLDHYPCVDVVVPARDEALTICRVVLSHASTSYPGQIRLVVVDDGSSDGTGTLAREAGAKVVAASPKPHGWSGKLWALHEGLQHMAQDGEASRWTLLTDADILHAPETLSALVEKAEIEGRVLVSLMARLDTRNLWGRLLIPAFIFFFQKLYPFGWVNREGHWCAAAAGGCILVRTDALAEIGGLASLKDALIDDCTLASRIKKGAFAGSIWLGLAQTEVTSLRDNGSFASNWSMVKRTAFAQLHHSYVLLAAAMLGMGWLYLIPPIALVGGLIGAQYDLALAGAITTAMMCIAYRPTLKLYDLSGWRTLTLPFVALLYAAMTFASAIDHVQGKGGQWKGRTYP